MLQDSCILLYGTHINDTIHLFPVFQSFSFFNPIFLLGSLLTYAPFKLVFGRDKKREAIRLPFLSINSEYFILSDM